MAYRRFIEVYSGHDADNLPNDVRAAVTDAEVAAFKDVGEAFKELAENCQFPSLRRLLESCAAAHCGALELNACGDTPFTAYFRFFLSKSTPAIRLPDASVNVSALPFELRNVYRSIGGIQDDDFQFAGGLAEPDSLTPMSDYWAPIAEKQQFDPAECWIFLSTFCGDSYCFDSRGEAILFNHETATLCPAGLLQDVLDKYFNGLADGTKL